MNPLVPPKYSMRRSSTSQLCGMVWPPRAADFVNSDTAPRSMSRRAAALSFLRFPSIAWRRQRRQRASRAPLFLRLK